jgi:hypothetical protein
MPRILTDEDKAEILSLRDSFAFDSPPVAQPPRLIVIGGPESSGKTHLALTAYEWGKPLYHLDTEGRGHYVTNKAPFKQHIIGTKKINASPRAYYELNAALAYIASLPVTKEKGAVVVLDSGTDLQTFAELKYLDDEGKDTVGKAYNWGRIFAWCSHVLKFARTNGIDLILTARVKDEFVGEEVKSGKKEIRIWKEAPYLADYVFQFNEKSILTVRKNSAQWERSFELDRTLALPAMVKMCETYVAESKNSTQEKNA